MCAPVRARAGAESGPRAGADEAMEVLLQIPFRSEIMELPLVALTTIFSLGAMVLLGRWWER